MAQRSFGTDDRETGRTMNMDYEQLRERRNEKNAFGNLVGVKIVEIREGYARTELEVRPELMNPVNSVHGGVLFTMIDITGGSAAVSHGENVTTVDADIRYLRPGIGVNKLVCEASRRPSGLRKTSVNYILGSQNDMATIRLVSKTLSVIKSKNTVNR